MDDARGYHQVDARDPGIGVRGRVARGLQAAAAGDQDVQVLAIIPLRPVIVNEESGVTQFRYLAPPDGFQVARGRRVAEALVQAAYPLPRVFVLGSLVHDWIVAAVSFGSGVLVAFPGNRSTSSRKRNRRTRVVAPVGV